MCIQIKDVLYQKNIVLLGTSLPFWKFWNAPYMFWFTSLFACLSFFILKLNRFRVHTEELSFFGLKHCWFCYVWQSGGTHTYICIQCVCLCMSVIQVLFLPCGGGDCTVGVHDHPGTADDHGHQQQAEKGDACQSQALVHVHEGWLRGALHLHDCFCLLLLSSDTPTHFPIILKTCWRCTDRGRR